MNASVAPLMLGDLISQCNTSHQCLVTLKDEPNINALKKISILGVTDDSRKVQKGSLFLACIGESVDGRQYIPQAISAGAVVIFAEYGEEWIEFSLHQNVPVFVVRDLKQSVSAIADCFYGMPSKELSVCAITGTNGKTTCTHLMAQLANALGQKSAIIGTLGFGFISEENCDLSNTGLTTPGPVGLQEIFYKLSEEGAQFVAMEASSHSLDQHRLDGVNVETAVFTNLSRDHLDYHGTEEAYGQAKQRLFALPSVRTAVINADEDSSQQMIQHIHRDASVYRYSISAEKTADLKLLKVGSNGPLTNISIDSPWGHASTETRLVGHFNLSNLAAALTVLLAQGADFDSVVSAIPNLHSVAGRMESVESDQDDIRVVVDYAHTPDALEKVLHALKSDQAFKCDQKSELWCVFGCGGDRDKGKRAQMGGVASRLADKSVVTSDNPRTESPEEIIADIVTGFQSENKKPIVHLERKTGIDYAIRHASVGDCILVAGKGHEDYQEINGVRYDFSDVEVARQALMLRQQNQNTAGGSSL